MKKGWIIGATVILLVCVLITCLSTISMDNHPFLAILIGMCDVFLDVIGVLGIAFCLVQAKK